MRMLSNFSDTSFVLLLVFTLRARISLPASALLDLMRSPLLRTSGLAQAVFRPNSLHPDLACSRFVYRSELAQLLFFPTKSALVAV